MSTSSVFDFDISMFLGLSKIFFLVILWYEMFMLSIKKVKNVKTTKNT